MSLRKGPVRPPGRRAAAPRAKAKLSASLRSKTQPVRIPWDSDLTLLAVSDLHCHDVDVLMSAARHFAPDIIVFAGDGLHDCAERGGDGWLRELAGLASIGVLAIGG